MIQKIFLIVVVLIMFVSAIILLKHCYEIHKQIKEIQKLIMEE